MRSFDPIGFLARALFLVMVGFVLSPGAASAHGEWDATGEVAHRRIEVQAPRHVQDTWTAGVAAWSAVAEQLEHEAGSCAGEPSGDHFPDGCCTIACHGALAATAVGDPAGRDPPGDRHISLANMLVGRSAEGTERPPKRG